METTKPDGRKNNGGRREGGGRKRGAATERTRATADKLASDGGKLPLELMTAVMREQWKFYEDDKTNVAAAKMAHEAAKDVAPYIHPRLSNMDKPVNIGPLTGDLTEKGNAVMLAMASGEITPGQAATIMQALSAQARVIEVDDLARRIEALEKGMQT